MSTKVDQASSLIGSTATVASSSGSTSGPKISKFAAKSGFVIPKNKLSGSLVPIFRGGKKGREDSVDEESSKQVQRKTKWGPDLTQDTAVRKGRALAYQTRVDQITQQLSSRTSENMDKQDLFSESQSSSQFLYDEKTKLLEIEKREAIGEILKLNLVYKAPADYKPLMKEDKVPIPIKDYPEINFIGLIFGTAQKRLEKETGAKIRVYGRKANSTDEVEVTTSEENETPGAYVELYVHVSADTYEKVDAAVALVELLVTPVNTASGSATSTIASGENVNTVGVNHSTPSLETSAVVNQGVAQTVGPAPALPPGNFEQYRGPWFPTGLTQTPLLPSSGFMNSVNPSAPPLNRPIQVSSAPFSNMPSLYGPRPIIAAGFTSMAQNPQLLQSIPQPQPVMQQQFGLQSPSLSNHGILRNPPMSFNQPTSTGPPPMFNSTIPQSAPPATFPNGGVSSGWSHQPSNMISPISHPLNTHTGAAINRPISVSSFHSAPQSQVGVSASASSPNFSPLRPPFLSGPRPQQANSSDFTFQPHRPQNPVSQIVPRPGGQSTLQNMAPTNQMMRPQTPSLQHAMHISNHPLAAQGFPRSQVSNQMIQPRTQMSTNFAGNSARPPGPLTHPTFQNQMQPRNFNMAPPVVNHANPFLPRGGNQMQFQQNFSAPSTQPRHLLAPNQQLNNNFLIRPGNLASGSPRVQVYDPFSPTSMFNPRPSGNRGNVQKQESDPEYEDLMASVGVK